MGCKRAQCGGLGGAVNGRNAERGKMMVIQVGATTKTRQYRDKSTRTACRWQRMEAWQAAQDRKSLLCEWLGTKRPSSVTQWWSNARGCLVGYRRCRARCRPDPVKRARFCAHPGPAPAITSSLQVPHSISTDQLHCSWKACLSAHRHLATSCYRFPACACGVISKTSL